MPNLFDAPMQKPSGGCVDCLGPVRTYKSDGWGWTCTACVQREKARIREEQAQRS
ncbi:hypothetical protein [Streptomyces sp. NBC_00105]|uniref:hypothetical protein n=1 Tax=Streptomyces sp. NBC_00105 TaxID=2903622 RepID=UPI003255FA25